MAGPHAWEYPDSRGDNYMSVAPSPTPQATEAERGLTEQQVAEWIARDAGCAQGEFHQRVLSIIPYLVDAFVSVREQERAACERASKRIAQKWHDIVSSPNTTTIGGACAAAAAEAAESIARAIRARKDSSHAEL